MASCFNGLTVYRIYYLSSHWVTLLCNKSLLDFPVNMICENNSVYEHIVCIKLFFNCLCRNAGRCRDNAQWCTAYLTVDVLFPCIELRQFFLCWAKITITFVDTSSSCISLEVVSTPGNSSTVNVWWMFGTNCQATSLKLKLSLRSRIGWTNVKIGAFKASASSALHLQVQVQADPETLQHDSHPQLHPSCCSLLWSYNLSTHA